MARIIITLEGRVLNYVKNISKSHPEVWEYLKPDDIRIEFDGKEQCNWLRSTPTEGDKP